MRAEVPAAARGGARPRARSSMPARAAMSSACAPKRCRENTRVINIIITQYYNIIMVSVP